MPMSPEDYPVGMHCPVCSTENDWDEFEVHGQLRKWDNLEIISTSITLYICRSCYAVRIGSDQLNHI